MIAAEDIKIKKYIVHILDNNMQLPVLSTEEHEIDCEVTAFVQKHIAKALADDRLKKAIFTEQGEDIKAKCHQAVTDTSYFKTVSVELAQRLFSIMLKNVDIPPADLLFCLFEYENTLYFAILKCNYKTSYIHYIDKGENGNVNSIIMQKTVLPKETQKLDECAFINTKDGVVKIIEKQYEINGEKQYYFSSLFLQCTTDMSSYEKVKLFNKATDVFKKEFFEGDFTKGSEIKKAVNESIAQNEAIDIEEVAGQVFKEKPEIKEAYVQTMEAVGLREKNIPVSTKMAEKTFKKQKIKTDIGIEIDLPIEYYNDTSKIEFLNNVDGTISIVIKNIHQISEK